MLGRGLWMDIKQAEWHKLYDDVTGRYQGCINVRTLTLILVGRPRDTKHELAPLIAQSLKEKQQGTLQERESVLR